MHDAGTKRPSAIASAKGVDDVGRKRDPDEAEATLLSAGFDNWKRLGNHETFMERLQADHCRKWSFWKQWSA